MNRKIHKTSQIVACLVCLITILTACLGQPERFAPDAAQPTPPDPQPESPKSASPAQSTNTSEPIRLYLDGTLPEDIFTQVEVPDVILSDDPDASLWFGPPEKAPEGQVQLTSTWVYALAAPFPTITDDVTQNDLRLFFGGHRHGPFAKVTKLYVPENLLQILDSRWFPHSKETVSIYQDQPNIENLWEENSWAILPFHMLSPKLKVISVGGISPLFKDFESTYYPLAFQFQLVYSRYDPEMPVDEDTQKLIDMIQHTNRDPEKMTTLIMTGVTALVRATAYKMEVKGVLYPGEAIQGWLSEADLTHISNEVSFYEDCPFPDPNSRRLLFCSDPKYIKLFEYIGADIIELTGNHNNDSLYIYGNDVVPFTLDLYEQQGMKTFGGGRNLADAKSPLLITHNGNQLAFIGCNAPGPDIAWATEDRGGAAPCGDYQWMVDEIKRLREEGVLPIATFQYYEDYYNFAESHHIKDFGRIAEAGAVIINGSQAHRPKAMTFYQDAYIDYGLGNLFFDQMGIIDDYGNQILQTRWEKIQCHVFYDGKHLSTELLTAILDDFAQPRPMTVKERYVFLEEIFTASGWITR